MNPDRYPFPIDVPCSERPTENSYVRCEDDSADVVTIVETRYTYTEVPRCVSNFTEIHNWPARKADKQWNSPATDAWSDVTSYRCTREAGHDGNHLQWALGSALGRSWSDGTAHYVYNH